jgi:hypothetical protein
VYEIKGSANRGVQIRPRRSPHDKAKLADLYQISALSICLHVPENPAIRQFQPST